MRPRLTSLIVMIDSRLHRRTKPSEIMTQTGAASLEVAFSQLTGGAEAGAVTADFLAALERV